MRASVLAAALLVLVGVRDAPAQWSRLDDEDVERFLEIVEERVESFVASIDDRHHPTMLHGPQGGVELGSYLRELESKAEELADRFDSDEPAGAEALSFLRHAHVFEVHAASDTELFGADAEWAALSRSLVELADVYGIDRSREPPLWRARRVNDDALEDVLSSLERAASVFRPELDKVSRLIDPDAFVGSEREDVVASAARIQEAAEALREAVDEGEDTNEEIEALMAAAEHVREFIERHSIARVLRTTWGPVARDLAQVETAFEVDGER